MTVSSKKICAAVISLAIIALIPLLVISFYSHPQVDDYYYGIKTYHAVQNGDSVLKAAAAQVKETYTDWQGTYSAVFLFSLHPAIWGENFYFISTFILLSAFIGSTFLFCDVVLKKYFNASNVIYLTVSTALATVSIQLAPSPVQSYFWWNGSVYYTFFYSLALLFFSSLLIYFKTKSKPTKTICTISCVILGVILGGGNFITALSSLFILFLVIAYLIYKKDKRVFFVGIVFIVFLTGFMISVMAPGNAVRQSSYTDHPGIIGSIIQSFFFSISEIYEFTTIPVVLFALMLFPLLSKVAKASKLSFKHPLLFLAVTFVTFTTQFTPTVYAWGGLGDKRIINIIFYFYLLLILANLFYLGGFVTQKYGYKPQKSIEFIKKTRNFVAVIALSLVVIIFAAFNNKKHPDWYDGTGLASASAIHSLYTGEAQQYDKENNERIKILTDKSIHNVTFEPLSVTPYCLHYGDLTQDPDFMWSNKPMREYFDKNYVVVNWTN